MNTLPALAATLPLAAATLLVAADHFVPPIFHLLLGLAGSLAAAVLSAILLVHTYGHGAAVHWFGGWTPSRGVALGIAFSVDPAGAALGLLAAVLAFAALLFSRWYLESPDPLYQVLVLLFLGAMVGFAFTADVFNLFVFFELMSVAAFGLAAHKVEEIAPLQGGFNFGVVNTIGGFLILTGIGLLYARTGALNMAQIGATLDHERSGPVVVAFGLMAAGLLVKGAAVPFHFWLADAHAAAPAPICALFSGIMVELGIYAVARLYWTIFAPSFAAHAASVRVVLLVLGTLTALLGGVMALLQRHLKRLLAYSTISNAGAFLTGVALLTPDGLAGTGAFIFAHALAKGALFLVAGLLLARDGTIDELELHGKGRALPGLGLVWLAATVALAGPPFLGTFIGHSLIDDGAAKLALGWVAPVLALSTALATGAIARAGLRVFAGIGPREDPLLSAEPHESPEEERATSRYRVLAGTAGALALAGLALGAVPGLAAHALGAAETFTRTGAYTAHLLRGAPPPVPHTSEHHTTTSSIVWATATLLGALLVGWALLVRDRVPAAVRRAAANIALPPLDGLRALHSGHTGDYVAWLSVGTAALGGALALALR